MNAKDFDLNENGEPICPECPTKRNAMIFLELSKNWVCKNYFCMCKVKHKDVVEKVRQEN